MALGKPAVTPPRALELREVSAQILNIAERLRAIEAAVSRLGATPQTSQASAAPGAAASPTALSRAFSAAGNGLLAKVSGTGLAARRLQLPVEFTASNADGAAGNPSFDWAVQAPSLFMASPLGYDGRPEFRPLDLSDIPPGLDGDVLTTIGGVPTWSEAAAGIAFSDTQNGVLVDYNSDGTVTITVTDAPQLTTPRNINGTPFDGTADIELPETILLPVTDETSVPTTGTAKYSVRLPRRFLLQSMRVSASVAQASGSPAITLDVKANGASVLATPYVLDNTVKTSRLNSTQPDVLEQTLSDDTEITVDLTQIASGSSARGIKVRLYGRPSFVEGDALYPAVSLLLQTDGADGAFDFIDTSPRPKTITRTGNPVFSTAVAPPFGTSAILFDGASSLSVPHSADFDFGSADWTIEFHVWVPTGAPTFALLSKRVGSNYGPLSVVYEAATRRVTTLCDVNTSDFAWHAFISTPTNGIDPETWYHVAVVRLGTDLRCFFNGVYSSQVIGAFTAGQALATDTNPLFIGATSILSSPAVGRLRGLRITRGFARYTTDFAAPTENYLEF